MPVEVATEISKRTKLLLWSMGRGRDVMRNIFLRRIFSAPIAVTCQGIQRFIAILRLNLTSCKVNASTPSGNTLLTSSQVLTRKKATWFECRQRSCLPLVRVSSNQTRRYLSQPFISARENCLAQCGRSPWRKGGWQCPPATLAPWRHIAAIAAPPNPALGHRSSWL